MPIEFLCPSCQQQLRVPDAAAGKNARCPSCSTIVKVPAGSQLPDLSPLSPPSQPGFDFGLPELKPSGPSTGGSFGAPPPGNPFGDAGAKNQWADQYSPAPTSGSGYGGPVNPYASPAGTYGGSSGGYFGGIGHEIVDFGTVFNHSFNVWQQNLGLLVGSTLVAFILQLVALGAGQAAVFAALLSREIVLVIVAYLVVELAKFLFQMYLTIGLLQIFLKVARRQRAELGDLFGGGERMGSVLGWTLLVSIVTGAPVLVGFLISILVGLAVEGGGGGQRGAGGEVAGMIFVAFMLVWTVAMIAAYFYFWPSYFLVVDGKSTVLESFGKGARISEGNKLNVFVIGIISFVVVLVGLLAACLGVFVAAPLAGLLFPVAYLMMSKQIPAYGNQR